MAGAVTCVGEKISLGCGADKRPSGKADLAGTSKAGGCEDDVSLYY